MKNILSIIFLFAFWASSCTEDELVKHQPASADKLNFTTSFEQNESRTYVEDGKSQRWTGSDRISLFAGNTFNQAYQFYGETGDESGLFLPVSNFSGTGDALDCHYAVYPYADDVLITASGVITTTLPAEQSYAVNSFGLGDNTMVAITKDTDDTFLMFKNVDGYLKLQLYGDDVTVKSITLTGNNHEKIAGKATITPTYGEAPTARMADDATETITLDCGEKGVKLGITEETATSFWMVVPPATFQKGFTVVVTDMDGKVFEKTTSKEIVIARNTIKPMQVLKVVCEEVVYDTLLLPDGRTFNSIVGTFLENNTNLTKIKFVANSDVTSQSILVTDADGTIGCMVANGEWLEIHTSANKFIAHADCSAMFIPFYNKERVFEKISVIDFGCNFDTSEVTNMSQMFLCCYNLSLLNVNYFNTSNVTDMSQMFNSCYNLKTLDVSSFDTSKVKSMRSMFLGCGGLTSLDVSNFDTSSVTDMGLMFSSCPNLTSLDVSNFDTSNVADMSWMFEKCSTLTSLNLSNFKTSNLVDMSHMFEKCIGLTLLDLKSFDISKVKNMEYMFANCTSLTTLDLSSFVADNAENMFRMFFDCNNLKSIDFKNFGGSKVTDMSNMFSGCGSLISLDLSSFNMSNVENMGGIFSGCSALTSIKFGNNETSNLTDMSSMFWACYALSSIDLSNFDTSNVINMSGMFGYCSNLTSIKLTKFNTSNVIDMSNMFFKCYSLTSLYLNGFDTSNVTNMELMFSGCNALVTLDVSSFNTSNVVNMESMFHHCINLTSLNLTTFSFIKSPVVTGMFATASPNTALVPVVVTEEAYKYLTETTTDCGIGTTAKFVKPDGTDW